MGYVEQGTEKGTRRRRISENTHMNSSLATLGKQVWIVMRSDPNVTSETDVIEH